MTAKKHKTKPGFQLSTAQLDAIYKLSLGHATEKEIAEQIKVPYETLRKHKELYKKVLDRGRADGEVIDIKEVENALFKASKGWEFTETHTTVKKDGDGNILSAEIKKVKKVFPPNPAMTIFYLCNRKKQRWQNTQKVEHSGKVPFSVTISDKYGPKTEKDKPNEKQEKG